MKIIGTTFEKLPRERLVIGFEGENLRATVRIDCASVFAEYPNATPTLIVKPLFADAYPVVVDRNGTDVDWLITSEILSFSGDGEIQLVFYKDEVICKSAVSKIRVCRSLQVTGDMPDPVAQWIDDANRKLAEVDAQIVELEGMVDTATDAATRAEQSASTASTKAEQAAGSAATATEKATEATNAAGTATAKAAEAEQSALTATEKATAAAESERIATAKAGDAITAAGTATAKAEQATEAAQTATEKAGDALASATAAHASEINASQSAQAASASQTAAEAARTAAETSATQAGISEQNAGTAAQTATQKAAEATQSATNAETFAGTATTKAEEAAESAQAASDAKTAVEQTAEQLAGSLAQIAQNTHDIAEHEQYAEATYATKTDLYKKADIIHNTASGAIASFPDGAEMPVDEVTVQINPVQDLHGYDHPWPAGGGKNKFCDVFSEYTKPTDYRIFPITLAEGTYRLWASKTKDTVTGCAVGIAKSGDRYTEFDGLVLVMTTAGNTNSTVLTVDSTWTDPKLCVYCSGEAAFNSIFENYNVQLESGAMPTSFEPYANICPITGWDGVQVWDDPKHGGLIEWNQMCNEDRFLVTGGASYTLTDHRLVIQGSVQTIDVLFIPRGSGWHAVAGHKYLVTGIYKKDGVSAFFYNGTNVQTVVIDSDGSAIVESAYSGDTQFYLNRGSSGNVDIDAVPQFFDLTQMFGAGNEPTTVEEFKALFPADYYPYNAGEITTVSAVNGDPYRHYSITLPTEAGTVYGGQLTIAEDGSGVLTVDRAYALLNDLNKWMTSPSNTVNFIYQESFGNRKKTNESYSGLLCSYYRVDSSHQNDTAGWVGASANEFGLKSASLTIEQIKADAAEGKIAIAYPLATPITYTLTASQICTLLGENNLWHDANGDISVGYKADTKLYIDNKITQAIAAALNS